MSRDPLYFMAGDVNIYRYVYNSSNNLNDPFGLWSWSAFGRGALKGIGYAAIGVGVGAILLATLPASAAGAVIIGGATIGSGILGFNIGQGISGQRIDLWNWSYRRMCEEEPSELWGENIVGIGGLAIGGFSGPRGPLFGRARLRGERAGFFNRGNTRLGWSWHGETQRNRFLFHGGVPRTPGHWHSQFYVLGPGGDGSLYGIEW